MDVRDLIPQHKSDFERTKKLKKLDKATIRPIIPELLVWLQDGNFDQKRLNEIPILNPDVYE